MSKRNRNLRTTAKHPAQVEFLLGTNEVTEKFGSECNIVSVGKRRDGGTRYWCLKHKANATAKYGLPETACRAAQVPPVKAEESLLLNVDRYSGGIALWGAVPPVYDTTTQPLDRGIHVHARQTPLGHKEIDATFRVVRVTGSQWPADGIEVRELDAIYYMVSSVFGFGMKHVVCTLCGDSHLDKDWFSVHPHRRHLCAGCGRYFRDTEIAVGNPIRFIQEVWHGVLPKLQPAGRTLDISQSDYPGGLQIWGSNSAIIWTSQRFEDEGIHVHAFGTSDDKPILDDTFSRVSVDGIELDPQMVRTLMAQSALPHIENRVVSLDCPKCNQTLFSKGVSAFTPANLHRCTNCGTDVRSSGRFRKCIGNPLVAILDQLAKFALRPPQKHPLGLLPETL